VRFSTDKLPSYLRNAYNLQGCYVDPLAYPWGYWGHVPPRSLSVAQNNAKMHQSTSFSH